MELSSGFQKGWLIETIPTSDGLSHKTVTKPRAGLNVSYNNPLSTKQMVYQSGEAAEVDRVLE